MSSARRSIIAMLTLPLLIGTLFLTPAANAWTQGGNYTYTGAGWTQTLFSGSRNVTGLVVMNTTDSACDTYAAEWKRMRTLQPTQTLLRTSQYSGCGLRDNYAHFSLGQQTTFGNFGSANPAHRTVRFFVGQS